MNVFLSVSLFPLLSACAVGLQTDGPLVDEDLDTGIINTDEPSSEPTSEPTSEPGNPDTDDTDVSDTEDTNSNSGTFIASLVSGASPLYGSTVGGDSVTITGGPFTSDATVTFGGYAGTVISNNGSMIRVNTPSAQVDGPVEVRIDMDDGYGLVPDPFVYFEDGLGKTATIGVINKFEYIGQYWTGGVTPDPVASAWTAFTLPADVHFWQLNTPALDTCARNGIDVNGDGLYDDVNGDGVVDGGDYYQYSGNLTVFDIGTDSITLQGTNSSISLTRGSTDQSDINYYMYEYPGDLDPSFVPDNAFYDLSIGLGSLAGMSVPQYARASKRIAPFTPSLNTATLQAISRTQTFGWQPSQADWIEIRMFQVNASNRIVSDVICNVQDDGSFTFQNIHHSWTTSTITPVYVQFTRVYENNITMPHNDGISRIIGTYTIYGAGYMN